MSRSWREWGAERKLRSINKEHSIWKISYKEDEEEVSEDIRVFVIVNEWTDNNGNASSEITGGKWFPSEDEAWEALYLIAEAHDTELGDDEASLQFVDHKAGLESEEYTIEELTLG